MPLFLTDLTPDSVTFLINYLSDGSHNEDFAMLLGELEKRGWDITYSALGASELRFHSID